MKKLLSVFLILILAVTLVYAAVTWTERQPAGDADKDWRTIGSDSDGSNLIACVNGGRLYTGIYEESSCHPTTSQLLNGGLWYNSSLQHSDWCRFKRGTDE